MSMREQLTAYQLVYYDFGAIDERERIIAAVNEYIDSQLSGSVSIDRTTLFRLIEGEAK